MTEGLINYRDAMKTGDLRSQSRWGRSLSDRSGVLREDTHTHRASEGGGVQGAEREGGADLPLRRCGKSLNNTVLVGEKVSTCRPTRQCLFSNLKDI